MFPLYTKTFGGKIYKHLHSVSPDNIFNIKFKIASPKNFSPNVFQRHLVQELKTHKCQISFNS